MKPTRELLDMLATGDPAIQSHGVNTKAFGKPDDVPNDLRLLVAQVVAVGYPEPEYEYRFHETRRWRFNT